MIVSSLFVDSQKLTGFMATIVEVKKTMGKMARLQEQLDADRDHYASLMVNVGTLADRKAMKILLAEKETPAAKVATTKCTIWG